MAAPQTSSTAQIIPGVNPSMSIRIGRSAAELTKPCFPAGTSRVSRSRATRASLGIRKRKPVSPQSPSSPNQESAVNSRTGKVAFGPWLGPYETHTDGQPTGPLFLDHDGNTYASLTGGVTLKDTEAQPPKNPAAAGKTPAPAATQQLYALVGKVVQKQAAQAVDTARKMNDWMCRGKLQGSGRCASTMGRAINQPRKC